MAIKNIEMQQKRADGGLDTVYPATKASIVKLQDSQNNFDNKTVEGAMNELFTNVSNGKELVSGAITGVDDSVAVPTNPTFNDLGSAISGISTGKKWASGSIMTDGYARVTKLDGSLANLPRVTVSGLNFKPSIINLQSMVGSMELISIYRNVPFGIYSKVVTIFRMDISGLSNVFSIKADVFPAYVNDTGFSLPVTNSDFVYNWVAYE